MDSSSPKRLLTKPQSAIPYGRQHISEEDIEAVVEVLRSDWLTQGPTIDRFESAVSTYVGAKHAVATCNATAALHVACAALGLGAGDLLWTSPITFVASANCGLYCGATVDFVDIDPATYNISVPALRAKLKRSATEGRLPKVLVAVHFAGQSCDMRAIRALSYQYGFKVVEDASHCIGGEYLSAKIGSCEFSDVTVFSFHPVKIITTGEGGIITTNDAECHQRMSMLRTHGITRDPALLKEKSEGGWYYEQLSLGWNYRMTDLQAALGISQLARVDEFVARRRVLVERYSSALKSAPVVTPFQDRDTNPAWHLYVVKIDHSKKARRQIFDRMRQRNILVNVHYIPVHLQPYYRALGFKHGDFPEAEGYYQNALTLPLYYDLSDEEHDYVVDELRRALA